jgi:hypothetical protein
VHTALCSLTGFLLYITIIHELTHVIMYTFASQPTPVKFRGGQHCLAGRGIDKEGNIVPRGESRESIEVVLTGGTVSLAFPTGQNILDVDPDAIHVVIGQDDGWRVLGRKCTFHTYSTH